MNSEPIIVTLIGVVSTILSGYGLFVAIKDPERFEEFWQKQNLRNPLLTKRMATSEFYRFLGYVAVIFFFLIGLLFLANGILMLVALLLH